MDIDELWLWKVVFSESWSMTMSSNILVQISSAHLLSMQEQSVRFTHALCRTSLCFRHSQIVCIKILLMVMGDEL